MDAYLEIIREDGTLERHRIEGDRITVGRSPTAGIPIPDASRIDPEHLMLAPRAGGCWVAVAQGATSPVRVRGERFEHGMLGWGTEIELEGIRLKITDALPEEKKEGGPIVSSPVLVAMFVIVPLVGWLLLSGPSADLDTRPGAPPPELFEPAVSCPEGGNTRTRADRDAEAAIAKAESYPFRAQDGVQAVVLYRRAGACYRAIGATDAAEAMEREAAALQGIVELDYRTHRLRLERALEQERLPDALLEARALLELLRHRGDDPYRRWLDDLARQLELVIEA